MGQIDDARHYIERRLVFRALKPLAQIATDCIHIFVVTYTLGLEGLERCPPRCWEKPPGCISCHLPRSDAKEMNGIFNMLVHKVQFGWHLPGDTNCSSRLYEIISAGAVPLIVGRAKSSLPFRNLIDWNSMSIDMPVSQGVQGILETLQRVVLAKTPEEIARMRGVLAAHRQHLLWHYNKTEVVKAVLADANLTCTPRVQ